MDEPRKNRRILTIPNALSMLRILMVPGIVWLYVFKEDTAGALILVALSALTDVVDGRIARRFDMVSDLGKALDPIADKLTQGALAVCLALRYPLLWALVAWLAVKEVTTGIFGLLLVKKEKPVHSAKWHGKVTTVLLYGSMMLMLLVPDLPAWIADTLILVCMAVMTVSFVLYLRDYIGRLKSDKEEEEEEE